MKFSELLEDETNLNEADGELFDKDRAGWRKAMRNARVIVAAADSFIAILSDMCIQSEYPGEQAPLVYGRSAATTKAVVAALVQIVDYLGLADPFEDMREEQKNAIDEVHGMALREANRNTENYRRLYADAERALCEASLLATAEMYRHIEFVEAMITSEVTHSERRGQLKMLIDQMKASERKLRVGTSDIPF